MPPNLIELISQSKPDNQKRFLLGICGGPAAGKSTLAAWIVNEWNSSSRNSDRAALLPMDGYHLANDELEKIGLLHLKGIPDTFDAVSFTTKLEDIKGFPDTTHRCPRFDRSIEASVQDAIAIDPADKLIVVEGNYLLLDMPPWNKIKNILNEIWFIEAEEELLYPRLIARHIRGGKSNEAATEKVNSTDLPNAKLIAASSKRADKIFRAAEIKLPDESIMPGS